MVLSRALSSDDPGDDADGGEPEGEHDDAIDPWV